MTKKLFGKIITHEGRQYRYNEEEAQLEWVTLEDYDYTQEKLVKIILDKPEVVDSIGLSVENAEADLMGYVRGWHFDIEEEIKYSF